MAAVAPESPAAAMPSLPKPGDIKIILLGDSAVGKSKLVERFLMDDYQPQQLSTFALTLFQHKTRLPGAAESITVDFWDTAGQERFNSMHPSYYHMAHACILCFDITRKITYKHLEQWYQELQQHRKGIPTLLVANKIDLDIRVTKKSFAFAETYNLPLFFVSASDGTNVVKLFNQAIADAVKYKEEGPKDFISEVLELIGEEGFGEKKEIK